MKGMEGTERSLKLKLDNDNDLHKFQRLYSH